MFLLVMFSFNVIHLRAHEPLSPFQTAIWIDFMRKKENKWYLLSAGYELQFTVWTAYSKQEFMHSSVTWVLVCERAVTWSQICIYTSIYAFFFFLSSLLLLPL